MFELADSGRSGFISRGLVDQICQGHKQRLHSNDLENHVFTVVPVMPCIYCRTYTEHPCIVVNQSAARIPNFMPDKARTPSFAMRQSGICRMAEHAALKSIRQLLAEQTTLPVGASQGSDCAE